MLRSPEVAKFISFTNLVVYCCDIDILLLFLYYFDDLYNSAIFFTTRQKNILRTLHNHLGSELCTSLLGIHKITGCNQTREFAGFTEKTCWKVLVHVFSEVSFVFRNAKLCKISVRLKLDWKNLFWIFIAVFLNIGFSVLVSLFEIDNIIFLLNLDFVKLVSV